MQPAKPFLKHESDGHILFNVRTHKTRLLSPLRETPFMYGRKDMWQVIMIQDTVITSSERDYFKWLIVWGGHKEKILLTHDALFLEWSHADMQELADFTGKNPLESS